jgi:beta-mannosidase
MKVSQVLHDNWQFLYPAQENWLPATVPGCIHQDLRAHELIPDPFWSDNELKLRWIEEQDWTYRATFTADPSVLGHQYVELVADGLDTLATVKLNGVEVGKTESMFIGYRWPVAHLLQRGENRLEITFASVMPYIRERESWQPLHESNDPVGGSSRIRKMQCNFGWDWGPRLVTCGIWKTLSLQAWDAARLGALKINQFHSTGQARVTVGAEIIGEAAGTSVALELSRDGQVVATGAEALTVENPELWWPHGQGAQPLYDLKVTLLSASGEVLDTATRRIGLRSLELVRDRNHEEQGETFYFRVNGRSIFAKGGNWIPAHSFVAGLTRADYEPLLTAMTEANMNSVRLWGGGIYEHEEFYDLCDELGLLIWHDFMFSCSAYPGEPHFIELVKEEADQQVARIHHRASLMLWCGNNEIPYMPNVADFFKREPRRRNHYAQVFHKVLPAAVEARDGQTAYWPSSPWSPEDLSTNPKEPSSGDVHFWGVWHAQEPVKNYEKLHVRFCSEFGMQSYCSPETTAQFCPPDQQNPFSPAMECHQKHGGGNGIIMHYVSQRYRFPKDFRTLSYLSQLNQAYCMKVGVEHMRYDQPYCMGAIYWQINDCWPVASWSSIEFGGRWRALHYEAKRFNAPALAYLRVEGEVYVAKGNYLTNALEKANVYAIYDGPGNRPARLEWSVRHLDGSPAGESGSADIVMEPVTSVKHGEIDLAKVVARTGGQAFVQLDLVDPALPAGAPGRVISRQTLPLTHPRCLELQDPDLDITATPGTAPGEVVLEIKASSLALAVMLWLPDQLLAKFSDNYFDLRPGEPYYVSVRTNPALTPAQVLGELKTLHVQESYL